MTTLAIGRAALAAAIGLLAMGSGEHAAAATAKSGAAKAAPAWRSPPQAGRPALAKRPVGDAEVIRTMADAMGFVRGFAGLETTNTLNRLQWNGTGLASGVAKASYSYSLSLSLQAAREDIRPASGPRVVRVVSGDKAWDESAPGLDRRWANDQAMGRRLQLLETPFGFTKAVLKAPSSAVKVTDPGPGGVVLVELNVDGMEIEARLDPDYRPRTIAATWGGKRYEASYGDYRDLAEYGVMFPVHIVHRVDGRTTLDLTVSDARVASYAIFPPPVQP